MARANDDERWSTTWEALAEAEHRETLRASRGAGEERRVGP